DGAVSVGGGRAAIKGWGRAGFLQGLRGGWAAPRPFPRWREARWAPSPGGRARRCDCVAELVSKWGSQPPWVCLVEPQGQGQPSFLVRVLQYLLGLHDELRHGPHGQDRYLMTAGIVNVCDEPLQSELPWVPPGQ